MHINVVYTLKNKGSLFYGFMRNLLISFIDIFNFASLVHY